MTVLEATQGIDLYAGCPKYVKATEYIAACSPCDIFAEPLLEQLKSGGYDRMSVLEIPRTADDWRAEHRTARKRADRAYRRGYVTDDLHGTGGEDWTGVNTSATHRQGRPMNPSYFDPRSFSQLPDFPCRLHATRVSGIFHDEGLAGYIVIHRAGDLALVSQILGHAAHLEDEIMYLLFQHALGREVFAPGLMVYNRHDSGTDGLRFFKERLGFEERLVEWLP